MSKPTKIFLALPSYQGWGDKFAMSLMSAMAGAPCPVAIHSINGDSLIPRARNNFAADFLASDASHLLFLDVDLEFDRAGIHRLMQHDEDVVGGVYIQKRYDAIIPVFNKLEGEQIRDDGLAKVRHVGTGMMLIARHVLETLRDGAYVAGFQTCDDEKHQRWLHEFFPIGVHEGRYESEDWAFCRLAREAGFDVWVDTQVSANHHGHAVYPNDAVTQLRTRAEDARAILSNEDGSRKEWEAVRDALVLLDMPLTEKGRR